jgi:HEAT repeat protein
LSIAKRRPSASAVPAALAYLKQEKNYYVIDKNADIGVREGDVLLGRFELDAPPLEILISSTGLGIATLDVWPYNIQDFTGERKSSLILISLKGEIRFRKSMFDLFGTEKDRFVHDGLRVPWWSCAWIDEIGREVIVVTAKTTEGSAPHHRLLRAVSFSSGKVRRGEPDDIVRAIPSAVAARDFYKLDRALDLASTMSLGNAKPYLPAILADEEIPLPSRLRAAFVLNDLGDKRGVDLVINTALRQDNVWSAYAIERLPAMLGEAALPILLKVVQQGGNRIKPAAITAFQRLGRKAVPALIRMLEDEANLGGQFDALDVLGHIGPDAKDAVPYLIRALRRKSQFQERGFISRIDRSAAWALGQIGSGAKDAILVLNQMKNDENDDVRHTVIEALKRIEGR